MSAPDFLIWHCAGCDAPAVGKKKPCDCPTNVGLRDGPNGKRESTWWDEPLSDCIAVPRELLKSCETAAVLFHGPAHPLSRELRSLLAKE